MAGCVGEFWTKICRAHLFPHARLDEEQFIADGIRFGKGLQLVNILRDLPADLKNGRCYLPAERLEQAKLFPEILLSPASGAKFLPLFHEYLDKAESHLAAGWVYTNTLPFAQFRVRLACAWPVLIGLRTIEKLRAADVFELQQRVKVSRGEVRGIIFLSLLACPLPFMWRNYTPQQKQLHPAGNWRRKTLCKSPSSFGRLRGDRLRGIHVRPGAGHSGAGRRARGADANMGEPATAAPAAPAKEAPIWSNRRAS